MATIREAKESDREALGKYGAALMRQHHAADPTRFIQTEYPESGYGRFLVSQIDDAECLVRVAEESGEVVGYVFASLEGISWRDLRGPCGFIHDVYVDERFRRKGIARQLLSSAIEWIRSHDMKQVVLWSKWKNEGAQRAFMGLGFRDTMVELTLDL